MEAAAVHFLSSAHQAAFAWARHQLKEAKTERDARDWLVLAENALRQERWLAGRLHALQSADSRIGFEASNHYYYVPIDLAEKLLNCRDLLDRWLPAQKSRW